MKKIIKTVYQCQFCRDEFSSAKQAIQHEARCKFNPANKCCYTCAHTNLEGDICTKTSKHIVTMVGFGTEMSSLDSRKDCPHWKRG